MNTSELNGFMNFVDGNNKMVESQARLDAIHDAPIIDRMAERQKRLDSGEDGRVTLDKLHNDLLNCFMVPTHKLPRKYQGNSKHTSLASISKKLK